jgi:hypothetical protein
MEAWEGKTEVFLEKREPAPEETEAMAEPQEVPEKAMDEMFRATEDRAGEQNLAVRHHRQLKKRAQGNGGALQKFADARGWFTPRAVPALRKGPGKKCRHFLKGQSKAVRNGKRVMIGKRHLERKKALYDDIERTLGPEVVRIVVETSVRLQKMSDRILWKCRPLPKRKR